MDAEHVRPAPSIYLCRHARTPLNAAGLLRGLLDPPLDEVGRAEAERLAEIAVAWGAAAVVSSPLRRARETAAAITGVSPERVTTDDRLVDRDYGSWAGSAAGELVKRFGSVDAAPGVEPTEKVLSRAGELLDTYGDGTRPRPVVLISHDIVNRLLLAHLDPSLGPVSAIPQHTACWNELCYDGSHWRVVAVDRRP